MVHIPFFVFFCFDLSRKWLLGGRNLGKTGSRAAGRNGRHDKNRDWEWEMKPDYKCMSGKWVMRHRAQRIYLWLSLFGLRLRCNSWIKKLFSEKKKKKKSFLVMFKGLHTEFSSLKRSNLFILWFQYVFFLLCFTAQWSSPSQGLQRDQCLRTHLGLAVTGCLLPEMKKVTMNLIKPDFSVPR